MRKCQREISHSPPLRKMPCKYHFRHTTHTKIYENIVMQESKQWQKKNKEWQHLQGNLKIIPDLPNETAVAKICLLDMNVLPNTCTKLPFFSQQYAPCSATSVKKWMNNSSQQGTDPGHKVLESKIANDFRVK